jgi:hypothetical protein
LSRLVTEDPSEAGAVLVSGVPFVLSTDALALLLKLLTDIDLT